MIVSTTTCPTRPGHRTAKATAMALRLVNVEDTLHALTQGELDAVIDPSGKTYLLRPAQEHLREHDQRLGAIIESTADVITVVNRAGTILSQNVAVTRVLGYEPAELEGSSIFQLVHTKDVQRVYSAFFKVVEGFDDSGRVQFEFRGRDEEFRLIDATLGKLHNEVSESVVFSLRLLENLLP